MLLRKITEAGKKKKKKKKIYREEYEEEVFIELPMEQNPHTSSVSVYYEVINCVGEFNEKN